MQTEIMLSGKENYEMKRGGALGVTSQGYLRSDSNNTRQRVSISLLINLEQSIQW